MSVFHTFKLTIPKTDSRQRRTVNTEPVFTSIWNNPPPVSFRYTQIVIRVFRFQLGFKYCHGR